MPDFREPPTGRIGYVNRDESPVSNLKDIPGLEGRYAISDEGLVYSYYSSRFLRGGTSTDRYKTFNASIKGKTVCLQVHFLVLSAFGPERPSPHHIPNHIDHNPSNNRIGNLEWKTQEENMQHAIEHGRFYNAHRLNAEKIRGIRGLYEYGDSIQRIAKDFGLRPTTIKGIVECKTWRWVKQLPPR